MKVFYGTIKHLAWAFLHAGVNLHSSLSKHTGKALSDHSSYLHQTIVICMDVTSSTWEKKKWNHVVCECNQILNILKMNKNIYTFAHTAVLSRGVVRGYTQTQ